MRMLEIYDNKNEEGVKKAKNKPIIGFSDVCSAQSALYTKTGRLSIHGPMPATTTWKKSGTTASTTN